MEPETLDTKPVFDRIVVGFDDTGTGMARARAGRPACQGIQREGHCHQRRPPARSRGTRDRAGRPGRSPQLHREQLGRAEAISRRWASRPSVLSGWASLPPRSSGSRTIAAQT